MPYRIKHHSAIDQKRWDEFVRQNSMGWAWHLYDFIVCWRNDNVIHESFAVVDEHDAICFIMQLRAHQILLHSMKEKVKRFIKTILKKRGEHYQLASEWGYVLADSVSPKQQKKIRQLVQEHLKSCVERYRCHISTFNLPPMAEAFQPNKCPLVNPVIHMGFGPGVRYTWVIDLCNDRDALLKKCSPTARSGIVRVAKQQKYAILESKGEEADVQSYMSLHQQTYSRTNYHKAITPERMGRWIFSLIKEGLTRIFFLQDRETKKNVAAVVILMYKNTAYYWWGCSDDEKDGDANRYLLFEVICKIREALGGKGYFDVGSAWTHYAGGKYKGLSDYKKSFGGFLHTIYKGEVLW